MKNENLKLKIFLSSILFSLYSYGDDYFDPSLLDGKPGVDINDIDLSQFSKSNSIPAGKYLVAIYVNKNSHGDANINFIKNEQGQVVPEVTPEFLKTIGVNIDNIPILNKLPLNSAITNLNDYIPDAELLPDISSLRLNISIPQIAMKKDAIGYIDPALLDDGISAFFSNYMINGNKQWNNYQQQGKQKANNLFVNLLNGFNMGMWRLRSNFTYTYFHQDGTNHSASYTQSEANFSNSYIMRNIYSLHSEVFIGENSTGNDIFDSIPFKGVKLNSNEQMVPQSMRGFAPEINGIAQSNAKITVRQNGNTVYQTYVSPGPFSIKDIYSSGSAGNLDVTITEDDGSERTFTVSFSALPVMQRPGGFKYELIAGRYDGGMTVNSKKADFLLASAIYGLPNNITVYGGSIIARDYGALSSGIGVSLGNFGALSADITHATAKFDQTYNGQSYRLRYSKSMAATGTSINLTALRYSTKSFYSFSDFNNHNYELKDGVSAWLGERTRSSFTTSLSQSVGQYGSIYLSGSRYDYWNIDRTVTQLSAGYNATIKRINFNISYSIDRTKDKTNWPENRQISFNMNIPFDIFSNSSNLANLSSSYSFNRDNQGRVNQQLGVNGTALDNKLSYSLSQNWANQDQNDNGSLSANYTGNKGTGSFGYNYSSQNKSFNAGMAGGVLLHSDGIILGRAMGNSMAIIEAPGAKGTELTYNRSEINAKGYGLVSYLTEYEANDIGLNVNTLPNNVTLEQTTKTIYPTKGAILKVKFDTLVGYQALINLKLNDGLVPFGAIARLDDDSNNTGIVGENGQLYMSGLPDSGKLIIQWGKGNKNSCQSFFNDLNVTPDSVEQIIKTLNLECTLIN